MTNPLPSSWAYSDTFSHSQSSILLIKNTPKKSFKRHDLERDIQTVISEFRIHRTLPSESHAAALRKTKSSLAILRDDLSSKPDHAKTKQHESIVEVTRKSGHTKTQFFTSLSLQSSLSILGNLQTGRTEHSQAFLIISTSEQ